MMDALRDVRPTYGRPFRALSGYAVFLGATQGFAIALSLGRVRITQPVALFILAAAAACGVLYARGLPGRPPEAEGSSGFARVLAVLATALASLIFLASWVAALAKPDLSWDGNTYHIPMVHFWARRGYIHWIDFDYDVGSAWRWVLHWLFNGYPKGVETISFVTTIAAGASYPVNSCNLWFLPLGVLGLLTMARRLGASRPAALATSVMFGVAPVMVGQGVTAYVDAGLADTIAAVLGCLVEVLARLRADRAPWPAALAMGTTIGLAASSKSSGLGPSLLAMIALGLTAAWLVARAEPKQRISLAMTHGVFLAAVSAVALVLAGYWYGRSWWYTGNPLSPVRVMLFGHEIFAGVPIAEAVSEDDLTDPVLRSKSMLGRIAYTWMQGLPKEYPGSIRYCDSRLGGLGFLWILACLPAIGVALVHAGRHAVRYFQRARQERGRPEAIPSFVFFPIVFAIVALAWRVTPMNWWSRYTVWVYAAGLPALALVVDATAAIRLSVLRGAARAWLLVAFEIAAFEALFTFRHAGLSEGFLDRFIDVPSTPAGLWKALTYYDQPGFLYPNLSRLDRRMVTSSETVAIVLLPVQGGPFVGQLAMPVGVRDIVLLASDTTKDEACLRAFVERRHIRWIVFPDDQFVPDALLRIAKDADWTPGFWRTFDVGVPDPLALRHLRAK
jgi:hypothetical protein